MSDSQAYEEVTVASEGVTVTKRFEEDEFPVPAIAFEFTSNRDEGVTVRLTDTVPDDIEVEDLGFHPEYGSEYWTIDDDHITFERDLEPNSSYTTVYGIRATGSDDVQQFLAEPTLEQVDPPLPEGEEHQDVIPESGDSVVKDAIAGDGEIPGLEDESEDEEGDEEDVGTLDLKDPNEPETEAEPEPEPAVEEADDADEADDAEAAGEETDGAEPEGDVTVTGDSLIAAMATEIREKNVSADDVKLLRQAFEIAAEEGGSTAAKIHQIQSDIADLRAYTSSLEEFLDDNGTAEEVIGDFEQQVAEFEQQLDELEAALDGQNDQLDGIDQEVDAIGEEVDAMSEELSTVNEDVDTLDEEISSVRREVNGLGNEFEELESAMEGVEGDIDELREKVTDGDVAERLDSLEDSIGDLEVWQEQIKETFGG